MKKIKVLVLSGMYPRQTNPMSGIFAHQQMKALGEMNVKAAVICPVPYSPKFLWTNPRRRAYGQTPVSDVIDGIPVYYPRYLRPPGRWFHGISSFFIYLAAKPIIKQLAASFKPDVLHTFASTPEGYAGTLIQRKFNIPHVCSLIGSDIEIYPRYKPFTDTLTKRLIKNANALIAVSRLLIQETLSIAIPQREIKLVYMGVDTKKFSYSHEDRVRVRNILNIPLKHNIILFIGSLLKTKGILELIEAFEYLSMQYGGIHLLFVGEGPCRDSLEKKILEFNLDHKVHLVGMKNHNEIPSWINASDILALPSYQEGLPNVVIEAAACSRTVVATKVGGIPEAVQHQSSGLLVNAGSTEELKNALSFLASNPDVIKSMGKKGRAIVEKKFSWAENARRTIAVYKNIIKTSN